MAIDLLQSLSALHDDERGATTTEYVVALILIACFVVFVVQVFGETLAFKFRTASEFITKVVGF